MKGVINVVSFENFITDGVLPVYLQIIMFIKRGIVSGSITDSDELPSRRVLSALLGVNPNTVQKAFALLESEGLIISRTGAKSLIAADSSAVERIKEELLLNDVRGFVAVAKQTGLTKEQTIKLIDENWD